MKVGIITYPGSNCDYDALNYFDNSFFIWHNDTDSIEYYDSKGTWTKIIQLNPSQNLVAMSHWVSNSVTIFEVNTKKFIRKIR